MVPADSGRVSRARPYSGTEEGSLPRRLRDYHPLWCSVPGDFGYGLLIPRYRPHDPGRCPVRFRLVSVRSPLLRESRLISFPPGTEMFQFPGSARAFRDRRSLGSSPGLIAAFHARILMTPRHPPRALRSLTTPIGSPRLVRGAGPTRGPHGPGSRARGVSRRGGGAPAALQKPKRGV